LQARKLTAP